MARPPLRLKNPKKAALLAWLMPGLGHFYQGRIGKGILYASCILGLYITGMILGEGKIVYWRWINPLHDPENFRFSYLCQFFVGLPALPALLQETLRYFNIGPILGSIMAAPVDASGMIDVARQNVLNELHPRLGKLVEVGSVYTMMAGLLNVLAIYDAYEGPAFADEDEAADKDKAAATVAVGSKTEAQA
jgi:hypothetical protein